MDHLCPAERILMNIVYLQCPSGGGSSAASMSAAALLCKEAWLMWACLRSSVVAMISYQASKQSQSISCGSPWSSQGKHPLFTLAADQSPTSDILRVRMTLRPLTSRLTVAIIINLEGGKKGFFFFFYSATCNLVQAVGISLDCNVLSLVFLKSDLQEATSWNSDYSYHVIPCSHPLHFRAI